MARSSRWEWRQPSRQPAHDEPLSNRWKKRLAFWRSLRFEGLEERRMLANIQWNGNAGDNNFTTPGNWIGGQVPGASDNAIIPSSSQAVTIDTGVTVESLVSGAPINITGIYSGSLNVTSGSTQLNTGLSMSTGTYLTAAGSGTTLTASGTVSSSGSLEASSGASISLPTMTSFTDLAHLAYQEIQASGTGSSVTLAGLTSIVPDTNGWGGLSINALSGGQVLMPALTSLGTTSDYVGVSNRGRWRRQQDRHFVVDGYLWRYRRSQHVASDQRRHGAGWRSDHPQRSRRDARRHGHRGHEPVDQPDLRQLERSTAAPVTRAPASPA